MPRYISILLLGICFTLASTARAGDEPSPAPAGTASPAEAGAPAAPAADDGGGKAHCTLSVPGMHCAGCAKGVTNKASAVDGVAKVEIRLADREVELTYDPAKTDPEKLKAVVSELYEATIKDPRSDGPAEAGQVSEEPSAPAS